MENTNNVNITPAYIETPMAFNKIETKILRETYNHKKLQREKRKLQREKREIAYYKKLACLQRINSISDVKELRNLYKILKLPNLNPDIRAIMQKHTNKVKRFGNNKQENTQINKLADNTSMFNELYTKKPEISYKITNKPQTAFFDNSSANFISKYYDATKALFNLNNSCSPVEIFSTDVLNSIK